MKRFFASIFRKFVALNVSVSKALNSMLPKRLSVDGNRFFLDQLAPDKFSANDLVFDVGGGSRPYISVEKKQELKLTIVGLDIDEIELLKAPQGSYDEIIAHDLCTFSGSQNANIVICQATLEHLPNTAGAVRAISTILKPGGSALIFAPSRNALFARLNLLLPQKLKEKILYTIEPGEEVVEHQGFPAHYDKCTPREIEELAKEFGLEITQRHLFWVSSYFFNFVPAFLIWRLWQGILYLVVKENAAETFAYVLTKPEDSVDESIVER